MAAKKDAALAVIAQSTDDDGVALGVTLDGTFVPLVEVAGFRVAQLKERAESQANGNGNDDTEGGS